MRDSKWTKLDESQIRSGYGVQSQMDMQEGHWACGPNSAVRAMKMLHLELGEDFDTFTKKCPKSWSFIWDIGPTPTQLAEYVDCRADGCTVRPILAGNFSELLSEARRSIDNKWPMMVLIVRNGTSMHYVNIIGYNDFESRVAIMDTINIIYWMTYEDLEWWLTADGHFLKLFSLNNFNGVCFKEVLR